MQDRTHAALRFHLHGGSTLMALAVAAAIAAATIGCSQEGPLTDQEMEQLRAFMLPAEGPPADTSNAFADNRAAAGLGKRLYFDGGYSGGLGPYNRKDVNGALGAQGDPGLVSCRSCHDPATGGADNRSKPNATSLGAGYTARNAPTVINAAYSPLWQFWDGRVDSLWSQALAPPEGGVECNSSRLEVVHFLYANYRSAFEEVFGAGALPDLIASLPAAGKPGDQVFDELDSAPGGAKDVVNRAYANFGKAIAAYERLLVSNNFEASKFDRFMNGDKEAMSPAAIRGARLFVGHAGCAECHQGAMLSDFSFHNVGAPQTGEYASPTDNGRFDGVTALTSASNMYTRSSALYSDDTTSTTYLESLKGMPPAELKGQFKTPTLRNVAKTAPYMHDGVYQTLWDVVNHYNFGGASGQFAGDKDPSISPLMLTDAELADLVEFLRALDDGETATMGDDLPGGLVGPP